MNYSIQEIAERCGKAKKTSSGWSCCCPSHEDSKPSLHLSEGDNGTILYHCFGPCTQEAVRSGIEAIGFNLNGTQFAPIPKTKIYYVYEKEKGKPYHRTVKLLPDKKIWVERYENGRWENGLNKQPKILYRLPELREAISMGIRVAIAEGEKDADRIFKTSGIACTTNMTGAGNWEDSYNKEFTGADVTIFYDNDKPGIERKEKIVAALKPVVKHLTVINLPEQYKDISEFWDADLDLEKEMYENIHIPSLADWADDATEWLRTPITLPEQVIEGLINVADKTALIGKSKTRKSFFALQMLLSIASGTDFLGFKVPLPRKCLLIQFEIKRDNFHIRLVNMAQAMMLEPGQLDGNLKVISARGKEFDDSKIVDYARREGFEVILFDPLYKMIPGDESKIEELKPILKRFDALAEETKAAIIYVHHDKKGSPGDQDTSDRGAGSGVLGRDYDSALFLTPHRDKSLIGLETIARNHAPREPQSIEWQNGCFIQTDVPFQAQTSRTAAQDKNKTAIEDWTGAVLSILSEGPLRITLLVQKLNSAGCTQTMCRPVIDYMLDEKLVVEEWRKNTKGPDTRLIKLI